jgi:hypothetical protein
MPIMSRKLLAHKLEKSAVPSEECHVILLIHYSAWVPLGKPKNSAKQEGWTTRVTLYAPSTLVSGA